MTTVKIKTVLAPNAPWPVYADVQVVKKRKVLKEPKVKKVRSRSQDTDTKFYEWLNRISTTNSTGKGVSK